VNWVGCGVSRLFLSYKGKNTSERILLRCVTGKARGHGLSARGRKKENRQRQANPYFTEGQRKRPKPTLRLSERRTCGS